MHIGKAYGEHTRTEIFALHTWYLDTNPDWLIAAANAGDRASRKYGTAAAADRL